MIINHNLSAINTNRVLGNTSVQQKKTMSRLSSGMRITESGDDAAGLAVSEKMRTQIRGLNQGTRNANDGVSFVQVAEGYLAGTVESLQRVRELAVQAATGTYSDEDRLYMQIEVSQMVSEVDRIANQAEFNGMVLFTGRFMEDDGTGAETGTGSIPMRVHMGANMDQFETISIGIMTAEALGLAQGPVVTGQNNELVVNISDVDSANTAIGTIDAALLTLSKQRADLGGYQNRLEMTVRAQKIGAEKTQDAESQIRDLDFAAGSLELTRDGILMQTGMAMLAQANMKNDGILRLLT